MNFKKFINSDYLKNNPLCGIDTYKDKLNLATGACTRKIKKLVLNGTENWVLYNGNYYSSVTDRYSLQNTPCICTHTVGGIVIDNGSVRLKVFASRFTAVASNLEEWKTYLQQQYQNGVPVIVWYFLAEPTTETITVPSGLSGTEEGYLNQSGTPTPTNPIYPTANTVEKWFDINHYIMGTSTDTLTTLPADIYANDTTATVGLKGDMSQTGTPTPDSPITPQGTGERTGNLSDLYNVDKTQIGLRVTTGNNMRVVVNGTKGSGNNVISIKTPNIVLPADTYTVTIKMVGGEIKNTDEGAFFGINQSTYAYRTAPNVKNIGDVGKRTFTISADTVVSSFDITPSYGNTGSIWENAEFECMLYSGTDNIDYEPFGIKIPISSAGQTSNIYLGEVQTTRRVKKLVLTGEETIYYNSSNSTFYFILNNGYYTGSVRTTPLYCSHYIHIDDGRPFSNMPNNSIYIASFGSGTGAYIYSTNYVDLADFKTYLQQQYAAGTPVTVWYVLATPQTAVVNEPLQKIGDYADTVSGITIPTITGKDTFDVLTTLKPSEVELTYTGWHDATVKEWDGSEWVNQ